MLTPGAITARFSCAWQITSRHRRVLAEAGLIHAALRGRERVYEPDADRLSSLTRGWLDRFQNQQ